MKQDLVNIALVVNDYDESIRFYTEKLAFELVEDTRLSDVKRWVRIRPANSDGCCLLLAKAVDNEQRSRIGNQSGGRVFLFLYTDNLKRDIENLGQKGVHIVRQPSIEEYGSVAVIADLYGNLIDLIEPK
jgi:catechol 2,3-dioxygenase-like lactoylglutathione lyase family enzyme